jgi:hypothetical protein
MQGDPMAPSRGVGGSRGRRRKSNARSAMFQRDLTKPEARAPDPLVKPPNAIVVVLFENDEWSFDFGFSTSANYGRLRERSARGAQNMRSKLEVGYGFAGHAFGAQT